MFLPHHVVPPFSFVNVVQHTDPWYDQSSLYNPFGRGRSFFLKSATELAVSNAYGLFRFSTLGSVLLGYAFLGFYPESVSSR